MALCALVMALQHAVLAAAATAAAPYDPRTRHRLLLDGPAPPLDAAAPAPAADTIIETLVDQKCSVMPHALITGEVLLLGSENPQPDDVACCASCLNHEGCTAWVYCPVEGGCTVEGSAITLVASSSGLAPAPTAEEQWRQLQLPYLGCRLLSIPAFTLHKDSPQILAKGPAVQFVSGTPVSIRLPAFPGYSLRPGTDTVAGLGYKCEGSLLLYSCILQGSVQDLAAICDADPLCKAFVYLPNGVDSLSEPIGVFKGGASVETIDISQLAANPATALYIKSSVLTTAGTPPKRKDHSRSSTSVLWIVLPTVLAVTLLTVVAVVWATLVMRKQARKQQAMAAAAAARQTQQKQRQAAARAKPGGGAAPASAPASGSSPFASLTVRLLKGSPPGSGSSCEEKGSSHGSATSYGTCVTGVPCPNCGATLGISCRHLQPPPSPQLEQQPSLPQGLLPPAPQQQPVMAGRWKQPQQWHGAPAPLAAAAPSAGSYVVEARHVVPQHSLAALPQGHAAGPQQ
ncbi:hypothetical protein ABPG75_010118 [Micractinium tetrahymenae]